VLEQLVAPGDAAPDLVGHVFSGRYRVEALIGHGGMGWVFRATHLGMQRTVALKIMRCVSDETRVRRFYREVQAGARLRHHHTVTVHDFGVTDEGCPYLVMEHLEGAPLSQLLRAKRALHPSRAVHIAWQICKALHEAHGQGVVHRDLKPSNIFLTPVAGERDYVKVLDFGVARLLDADADGETLTETGAVVGTPRYTSPEQAQGQPVDQRADLYSLGVLLFHMLAGAPPFDAPSPAGLLVQHLQTPPPPLPVGAGEHPGSPALAQLVEQLLAKEPAGRPSSAWEVGRRLAEVAASLPAPRREAAQAAARRAESAPADASWSDLTWSQGTQTMDAPQSAPTRSTQPQAPPGVRWFWPTLAAFVALAVAAVAADVLVEDPVPRVIKAPPAAPPVHSGAEPTTEVVAAPVVVPRTPVAARLPAGPTRSRARLPALAMPVVEAPVRPTVKRTRRAPSARGPGVNRYRAMANVCWSQSHTAFDGRRSLRFNTSLRLTSAGHIVTMRLTPPSVRNTSFARCLMAGAESIRFEVPSDGRPLAFSVRVRLP